MRLDPRVRDVGQELSTACHPALASSRPNRGENLVIGPPFFKIGILFREAEPTTATTELDVKEAEEEFPIDSLPPVLERDYETQCDESKFSLPTYGKEEMLSLLSLGRIHRFSRSVA